MSRSSEFSHNTAVSANNDKIDNNSESTTSDLRKIKSFVIRNGRFTKRQQFAVENYWADYGVDFAPQIINFAELFNNNNPVVLEIGYGMGDSLISMAQQNPHLNYLGIEVHLPGVGNCIAQIQQFKLTNLKLICHDAVEVIEQMIAPQSLQGLQLFFPDPWPKARHHKRRIVNQQFLDMIIPRLVTNGFIHFATDWENYAQAMLEHLQQRDELKNTAAVDFIARPEHRPLTKFEKFGTAKQHQIFDLYYLKK